MMIPKNFIMIGFVICVYVFILTVVVGQEIKQYQPVYSLRMFIFKNETAELKDVHVESGTISYFPVTNTSYAIKVVSFDDKTLFDTNLGVSFIIIIEPGQIIETDSMVVQARIPVYETAKWIIIQHYDKEILRIDLSEYFCNKNGICDLGENKYICPEDCEQISEIPEEERGFQFLYIIMLSLVILILIAIFFVRKRR